MSKKFKFCFRSVSSYFKSIMTGHFDIDVWKKCRKEVMLVYYASSFYAGLLHSGYVTTEYLYIKDIVQNHNPLLYFSIVLGASRSMAVVSAVVGSIYYDFTFDVRSICLVVIGSILVGNILYVLPYSIWFIFAGAMFINVTTAAFSGIIADITHIFEETDITSTMGLVVACRTIGMLCGPCLAFAFVKVKVVYKNWYVDFGNMPGIVLGSLGLLLIIWMAVSMQNLAQIYDLKAHAEKEEEKSLLQDEQLHSSNELDEDDTFSPVSQSIPFKMESKNASNKKSTRIASLSSYFRTAWSILVSRHYCIILMTSAVAIFSHILIINLFTTIAVELLHWGVTWLAVIRITTMVGGLIGSGAVIFLSRVIRDFIQLYVIVATSLLPVVIVSSIPYIKSLIAKKVLLLMTAFYLGGIEAGCHIVSIAMIAKLVDSRFQGIAEAVRLAVFHVAFSISGFIVSVVFNNIIVSGSIITALILTCVFVLMFEIEHFMKKDS